MFGICLRVASDWRKKTTARREAPMTEAPTRSHSGETATREIAMRQARQKLGEALLRLDEDKRASLRAQRGARAHTDRGSAHSDFAS